LVTNIFAAPPSTPSHQRPTLNITVTNEDGRNSMTTHPPRNAADGGTLNRFLISKGDEKKNNKNRLIGMYNNASIRSISSIY
jgi:hypothetical protein